MKKGPFALLLLLAITPSRRARSQVPASQPGTADAHEIVITGTRANGGDGRFDLYLVRMHGADGVTSVEPGRCLALGSAPQCASFVVAEANFEASYPSAEQGIHTVIPHELFLARSGCRRSNRRRERHHVEQERRAVYTIAR